MKARLVTCCPKPSQAITGWRERGGRKTRCAECRTRIIASPDSFRLREERGFELVCPSCTSRIKRRNEAIGFPTLIVPPHDGRLPDNDTVDRMVSEFERRAAAVNN